MGAFLARYITEESGIAEPAAGHQGDVAVRLISQIATFNSIATLQIPITL
jgi:hypothetical protein